MGTLHETIHVRVKLNGWFTVLLALSLAAALLSGWAAYEVHVANRDSQELIWVFSQGRAGTALPTAPTPRERSF